MSCVGDWPEALYRDEVLRARRMRGEDKLLEGPRLFARACHVMADGIRHMHPDLDAADVTALLHERLDRVRTLDE